jgi:hypothetical protein
MDLFAIVAVVPTPETPRAMIPGRRARHEPRGSVYNLAEHFDVINRVIFKGVLEPATLRWSRNRWQHTLGLADVKKRVITLNTCLDDARVPDLVVAAIMHHEMLHLYLGISEGPNGGRRFHTPQFRAAEKAFPGYQDSERWIHAHWPLKGRPARKPREVSARYLDYLAAMESAVPSAKIARTGSHPAGLPTLGFPDR